MLKIKITPIGQMGVIFLFCFLYIKEKYSKKGEKLMPNLSNDPNVHYVKFMRGSVSAWETLKLTPEKISNDTLYFIYQNA
jgi:hypothetical protein